MFYNRPRDVTGSRAGGRWGSDHMGSRRVARTLFRYQKVGARGQLIRVPWNAQPPRTQFSHGRALPPEQSKGSKRKGLEIYVLDKTEAHVLIPIAGGAPDPE
ncbi:hypothetical protein YTPLAS18_00910 [Nitrospira sp.]|nr:hypothetical protein YTPLAS18_00910 [Nitrospira sp.]